MKTSIKTLTTICTVIISLSITAQRNHNGQTQPQNQPKPVASTSQNDKHHGPNWGGNVNIHIGNGYPNSYSNNYGYGYYNNSYYSVKKAARNSIRQSANVIGQALQFSDWNDTYSPWLAKAIRHQQYAKQLYFWGDYAGALNHAERAGFLAWNTLSYFNDPYGYNNNAYPDPYSDPNNPYYRQSSPNSVTPSNSGSDDDYGYRKASPDKTADDNGTVKREAHPAGAQKMGKTELDGSLPQNKLNDRELLKINAKDLDIE
ncbi:MAG: hypothetical protein V4580_10465 [Bacteroidota bacterium]